LCRLPSEPTPSHQLWATALGATPALPVEHTTDGRSDRPKPERSTLPETGTFYFALTFLGVGATTCRLDLLNLQDHFAILVANCAMEKSEGAIKRVRDCEEGLGADEM
jgi:hypothetical protein